MSRARRTAVWLLSWTLAFPGNVIVAAVGAPLSSLDAIGAGGTVALLDRSTAYAATCRRAAMRETPRTERPCAEPDRL